MITPYFIKIYKFTQTKPWLPEKTTDSAAIEETTGRWLEIWSQQKRGRLTRRKVAISSNFPHNWTEGSWFSSQFRRRWSNGTQQRGLRQQRPRDREFLSRPPWITISTARSFAIPPNRDLPGEIRHGLFLIAISTAISVATSMLKIATPTQSWFISPSYSPAHRHRCRDFRPIRRDTDRQIGEKGQKRETQGYFWVFTFTIIVIMLFSYNILKLYYNFKIIYSIILCCIFSLKK